MKEFELEVELRFRGRVFVNAENEKDAMELVKYNFRGMLGHCENNQTDFVFDWDFPRHSEETKVIAFIS